LSKSPPPLRTPRTLTQKLWQNASYLQLSGLINWFYVVITIFAQQLNICSPKLVEWWRLLPPPGYTSGNSYWWLCGFDPFVAVPWQPRTPRSEGPNNVYCISKLEPSLYSWLLLFWFLPSMQSR